MSEIEKMYENAGIKKEVIPCPAKYYGYNCTRNNWDDEDCSCDIEGYPPFTAEKQIAIENVILQNKKNYNKWLEYNINVYGERVIRFVRTDKFAPYVVLAKTRAEALANVINNLWQDLKPEEKQQIREILE